MSTDVRMRGFGRRATVDETWALISARAVPLGLERVPFRSSLGRVLAEDIVAPSNVPPHPRAAMDGYAVKMNDLPGTLRIVGEVMAAGIFARPIQDGETVRVMTGARVPDGADAVVMVEETKLEGAAVKIDSRPSARQHILETGADLRQGEAVLRKGRRMRPQDVSMLVSVGALEVTVQRRPRVRIVPTGTELVRAGARATGSEIVESNSFMLEALALRDGAEPILHPIVPDDLALLRRALTEPGADVIVVTGGSSVGKEDYPPLVLREVGELPIHGIDVKPASPTGIGFVGSTVVVLAPGYPVASFVAWDLFVRPIVQRMIGVEPKLPYSTTQARLAREHKKPAPRVEVQRVTLNASAAGPVASVLPGGAALLSTVTRADGFVLFPAGPASFPQDQWVEVHLYA